jgi:drug/metabolite transporter (DMT)-like permease
MTVLAMKMFNLSKSTIVSFRTAIYTTFALIAFAANSILCRLALSESSIDPASFTTIRLVSGAILILLMTIAGVSWGVYSLRGRGVDNPVAVTGDNFLRSVPPMIAISLFLIPNLDISMKGVILAFLSGAVTSGIGYVIWYAVLGDLSATRAAMVQLLVPVIAALGGVLFLTELITFRLIFSAILIISGVGSCLFVRK